MLETLKLSNKAIGRKQVLRALQKNEVARVYVAQDADPLITQSIVMLCEEQKVPIEEVRSMVELGRICGISVGSAAVAELLS